MAEDQVLVTCPRLHCELEAYEPLLNENDIVVDMVDVDQQLTEAELLEVIHRYDAVIAGDDEFTATVFDAADRLHTIVKWGIGTDSIDIEAANDHGVTVRNTPDAFGAEVAEIVMGYAVMLLRELHTIDQRVRDGEWYCPRGRTLAAQTMGVIGVGSIGRAVCRRASAYDIDIVAMHPRELPTELIQETGVERVSKAALFKQADIVSVNCPLTEQTRNLVGVEELDRLGSRGYLINTARGDVVAEDALKQALTTDRIAGAALDVYSTEPLPSSHPFTELSNVLLGSHNASNTEEAVSRVNERAVSILLEELRSKEQVLLDGETSN
jgi:D-3-phosphoglycerate dehydrogenase